MECGSQLPRKASSGKKACGTHAAPKAQSDLAFRGFKAVEIGVVRTVMGVGAHLGDEGTELVVDGQPEARAGLLDGVIGQKAEAHGEDLNGDVAAAEVIADLREGHAVGEAHAHHVLGLGHDLHHLAVLRTQHVKGLEGLGDLDPDLLAVVELDLLLKLVS